MNRILPGLVLLLCLVSCTLRSKLLPVSRPAPAPVRVKVLQASSLQEPVSTGYVGTVSSSQSAVLTVPSTGTLVSLPVREGMRVRKGQVVARVASQTVESACDAASARLAQAEDGWQRVQKVYKSGTVTEVDYLRVKTQLEEARSADAAARSARERCTVKAPLDGVVEKVYLSEGVEAVLSEPIARIVNTGALEIRFPLPENEFPRHRTGERVRVEIPSLDYTGEAVLRSKGVTASSLSHSYECTVSVPAGLHGLMPGMVCKVYLEAAAPEGMVIPASAVMTDMEGRFVWTATGGTVDKKHVTVGGYSGGGILVTGGLSGDDLVIIEGSRKVSTGMHVEVQ